MKKEDFEKGAILIVKDHDEYFLAKVIDLDTNQQEKSIDDESIKIGKLTIFSKKIGNGVSCIREFLLEKSQKHTFFFWMRNSSLLAGMPTHSKIEILAIATEDLNSSLLARERMKSRLSKKSNN